MKIRQDRRWPDAHVRLKKLYEERVPDGMSQEQFGAEYKIGSQGMVWQYLSGYTPLNYDAAAKFAEGLRCTIRDISPEMDRALRDAILPALGIKSWRRAAAYAFLALGLNLLSGFNNNAYSAPADAGFFAKSMNRIHIVCRRWLAVLTDYCKVLDIQINAL